MKGQENAPVMIIAVVIFAGFFFPMILTAQNSIVENEAKSDIAKEQALVIDAANSIETCFLSLSDGEHVTAEFLKSNDRKDLDDICRDEKLGDFEAFVEDISTGETWEFDDDFENPDHSIWITILDGEKRHMGVINVRKT